MFNTFLYAKSVPKIIQNIYLQHSVGASCNRQGSDNGSDTIVLGVKEREGHRGGEEIRK